MLIRHLDGESRFLNPSGLRVSAGDRIRTRTADPLLAKEHRAYVGMDSMAGSATDVTPPQGTPVVGHVLEVHGVDRSDPLPNPQLIEQAAAPLLAVLVVAHSLGDELSVDRIREPHIRGLVDNRPVDLGPEGARRGRA